MTSYPTEQKTLLPLAAPSPQPTLPRRSSATRTHELLESCALALILFLAASQCLVLYGIHGLPYTAPSSAVCVFVSNLAAGLRLSMPAGLPTATLMFVASPFVARPERMLAMWYLILLCYLAGSMAGALLLVWVCEVAV